MSQVDTIKRHLRRHGSITPWEAIRRYRILALSQRIGELKRAGTPIARQMVQRNGKRFAKYSMKRALFT